MARIRSIKPEFSVDQDLANLSRDARLLYILLWPYADEECRMQGDPRLVKSWCFPLDDDATAPVVDGWLTELADAGKVVRYRSGGSLYLWLPKMAKHQKLDPRIPSRLPEPPGQDGPTPDSEINTDESEIDTDKSGRTDESHTDPPQQVSLAPAMQVAGGREQVAGGREQVAGARARRDTNIKTRAPEVFEIDTGLRAWAADKAPDVDLTEQTARWLDHHRANGSKFVDWHAAWRKWMGNAQDWGRLTPGAGTLARRGSPMPNKAEQRTAHNLAIVERLEHEERLQPAVCEA